MSEREQDLWIYFVHGSAASVWNEASQIRGNRGGGDFGTGFYTLEDTNWGRRSASAWARRKASAFGGLPVLVRVRMQRSTFVHLDREDISEDALAAAYNILYPNGQTGKELVVGPVGRRGADGQRVADKRLPLQYKFEGSGVTKLILDRLIPAL